MSTLPFNRQEDCKSCEFHAHTSAVCIPTCRARDPLDAPIQRDYPFPGTKKKALLVVGEAPGREEEARDAPFSGPTGIYLWTVYLNGSGILRHADVYTANAVRCRPPGNVKPNSGHRKACRNYLETDIEHLSIAYKGGVTILCVGATATQQVLKMTLTKAFQNQGTKVSFPTLTIPTQLAIPVFSTYHPAYLLPRRNPSAIGIVRDHLNLLLEHLKDQTRSLPEAASIFRHVGFVPKMEEGSPIALDIETYGAVEEHPHGTPIPPQRYFHPDKSMKLDGIPRNGLIKTVAITTSEYTPFTTGLTTPPQRPLSSYIYRWEDPQHRTGLRLALVKAQANKCPIIGMNLVFDLMYLRASDPCYRAIFTEDGLYGDVSILSYLHNELRPERDLKSLSALFKLIPYMGTLKGTRYKNSLDPALHDYNMRDTENTLLLWHTLRDRISKDYGKDSTKLSDTTFKWYSQLIWLSLKMTEAGVAMDEDRLFTMLALTRGAREKLERKALNLPGALGGPIKGSGSAKHITAIMEDINSSIESRGGAPLEKTGIRNEVSSGEANRTAAKQALKPSWPTHRFLRTLDSHRTHMKLETSYLLPLLKGRGAKLADQSSRLLDGISHPSWYLVPSKTQDAEGSEGGTNQGRIICKRPALQTAPPSIKKCMTTRFSPGILIGYDLSQIELRVAALISGDTRMLDEYHEGKDKHTETARAIQPPGTHITHSMRQVGKMMNFLMLYRGGAATLQRGLRTNLNQDVPLSQCTEWINRFHSNYHVLNDWQENLITYVCEKGYLELPILGQSRLFLGSPDTIRSTYTNAICNFPVQCMAANIMLSAQSTITRLFTKHKLRALVGLQIYDAIYVECPRHEETIVHTIVSQVLPNPPFLTAMEQHYGRTVPLAYDADVLAVRQPSAKEQQEPEEQDDKGWGKPNGTGGHS